MISRRNYLAIVMLIITIFIMCMIVGRSNDFIINNFIKIKASDKFNLDNSALLTAKKLNIENIINDNVNILMKNKKRAAIISENERDTLTGLITEWCVYNKYLYKIYTNLPAKDEIDDYSLIIFGDFDFTKSDKKILYEFADLGKSMIVTKLPDYQAIRLDKDLAGFFGIDKVLANEVKADGIKIFSQFMINGERIYEKGDYFGSEDDTRIYVPHFKLSPGYEVYAVGLIDDYDELGMDHIDLPPLLWRTKTRNSFVFVVGSDVFRRTPLIGILTGFMANESDVYLYPVINAQTISLVDFPYLSDENNKTLMSLYTRSSKDLARDILWPNIVQILKNYGGSYNFFAASQLDYLDIVEPKTENLKFYIKEIQKLAGNLGLSLSQVSDLDIKDVLDINLSYYSQNLTDKKFTSLYLGSFNENDFLSNSDHELLKDITLVMSDYNEGDRLLDLINEDVLSVKFNLYGYRHETMDDILMITIENALGLCNMKVDIGRVIFPNDKFDEWNNLSLIWSKGDTYFNEFSVFDMVSVSEMEKRIRRFLALDYTYEYDNNKIDVNISNFDKEAYFILSVYDKNIDSVENGTFKKIRENKYLIKATDDNLHIKLKEEKILGKPKNNRSIHHDPYAGEEQP